ncbi:glycoside hydrolase family 3 protein [Penicillium sp. IBT 16267x]|nr:glycoside hydrolase family 3 protein [Penicillium sp. IBT 16267x]
MFFFKTLFPVWLAYTAYGQGDPKNVEPDVFYSREPDSPYSYPSPNATGIGGWDIAIAKAKAFVCQLTTEEKVSLSTGTGFPPSSSFPISKGLDRKLNRPVQSWYFITSSFYGEETKGRCHTQ